MCIGARRSPYKNHRSSIVNEIFVSILLYGHILKYPATFFFSICLVVGVFCLIIGLHLGATDGGSCDQSEAGAIHQDVVLAGRFYSHFFCGIGTFLSVT